MILAQQVVQQVVEHSDAAMGGYVLLAITILKVVEKAIEWLSKKVGGESEKSVLTVKFDEEATRQIRETNDSTKSMKELVMLRDSDGTPMIYTSRSGIEKLTEIAENLTEHMRREEHVLKDIISSQERIVKIVERIEERQDATERKSTAPARAISG